MVSPHHFAHWYPTAAYLYVLWLDALALAWEYLRRHPDYRLDWLRRHRRRRGTARRIAGACACWKTRPWMRATRIRPGCPAMMPWCSSTRCRSAARCRRLRVLAHPGHKQLLHDGKGWR
jgi:hypothetical protein